jgi:hypothetical protein
LIWKPERKRPVVRPRRRWEDNIREDLEKIGCGLDLFGLGYGPVAGCCEHGNELSGWNFLNSQQAFCSMELNKTFLRLRHT